MIKEIVSALKKNSASEIIKAGSQAAKSLGKRRAAKMVSKAFAGQIAKTAARAGAVNSIVSAKEQAAKYNYSAQMEALNKYNSLINMNPVSAEGTGSASKTGSKQDEETVDVRGN